VIAISAIAVVIGALSALIALGLLRLIGLFMNLFFYHRVNTTVVSLANERLGLMVIIIPAIGGLVIGLMARYGSERIRGHGIPEAIEAILIGGSRVEPRVAILKPLSSALSIGTGGPFGAEGPIIMTGGAFGSIVAQFIHLSSVERKTLLVAGAAGGMSATFGTPLAAVLLSVELLLFEWKPRSLLPVALASTTAAFLRHYLLGSPPLFPVPPHPSFIGPVGLLGCVLIGLSAGALSAALTTAVYASEDAFGKLPIHWMWWPAIGGCVVGLGGFIFPDGLGVGYSTIGALLNGSATTHVLLGVLFIKSVMWAVSLGSGTSGGVLAPLLMIGGALGGIEAGILPAEGAGFWPLVSMAAILGGTMRSPLTGVVFMLELTHDGGSLLPLLLAVMVAYGFTVLTLRRSILTEKISRHGHHLTREYSVDPLETIFVREVMRTDIVTLPGGMPLEELAMVHTTNLSGQEQRLFPVVGDDRSLIGIISRSQLLSLVERDRDALPTRTVANVVHGNPVVASVDETLRAVVYRMAERNVTRLPVIERAEPRRLAGIVSLTDLLQARTRDLESEHRRERGLRTSALMSRRRAPDPQPPERSRNRP